MMRVEDKLKNCVTKKPEIIKSNNGSYVIIGSMDHGQQIPFDAMSNLINSLEGCVALKMEGTKELLELLNPMSAEILTKVSVGDIPFSFLQENDGNDIGEKLLQYGVPMNIAEAYIPCMYIRMNDGAPNGFFEMLPVVFEEYKKRFSFINTSQAIENFLIVAKYWEEHQLEPTDLDHFSYDFEKFMGDVREYEFWKPDLKEFRMDYNGKIAVCCGRYHAQFVKSIFEEEELTKPDWANHLEKRREDFQTHQNINFLKKVYCHLENALK